MTTPIWSLTPLNRLIANSILTLVFALIALPAAAALLRHNILESDTAESMQLERICFALRSIKSRLICLPTPYLIEDNGHLGLNLGVKANEKAYRIANRVLAKDVDKAFLDSLFADNNFQSISGAATLRAIYSGTSLSYTPLHVIGAFKLGNPSLPEVHAAALRQSVFRLTQNVLFKAWPGEAYDLLLSPSVFYFQRLFAYLDSDLLAVSIAKLDHLIERKKSRGVDGDFAMGLLARRPYWPSASIKIENVASYRPCKDCDERFFDLERYFGTLASISTSLYIPHPIGQSLLGVNAPFFGPYRQYDTLKTTVGYAYKLSKLEAFATFAPIIYTFGFLFDSEVYRLGILYTDEKQDNSVLIKRQKQTYVFTSFFL